MYIRILTQIYIYIHMYRLICAYRYAGCDLLCSGARMPVAKPMMLAPKASAGVAYAAHRCALVAKPIMREAPQASLTGGRMPVRLSISGGICGTRHGLRVSANCQPCPLCPT